MSKISTHILDTSIGKPAPNVSVALYRLDKDAQMLVKTATTDNDGRIGNLAAEVEVESGIYELQFEVEAYFEQQNKSCFYPSVSIRFKCTSGEHYHVPLLLNPYGYSTYRGS